VADSQARKVRWHDLSDLPRKVPWMSKHGKCSQASRQSRARSGPWSVRFHPTARAEADAVHTEAQKDKAGFDRAVSAAKARLAEIAP
jgi:hypothetical protein